ncbi:MAG: DNA-binding protein [Bacteroidota bacterium]
MKKDLTTSDIHHKNILNNKFALEEIKKVIAFRGVLFESALKYTKSQVANFYNVDERTIDRYVEQYKSEFETNGYEVLSGERLKQFKYSYDKFIRIDESDIVRTNDVSDIDVVNISKAPKLGVFDFRTFLNIGMLLTESDPAKLLRTLILDIVIDTLNEKIGGSTKYVNQREDEFLPSAIREFNYRQSFTNALDECIVENKWKYAQFTDAVYKTIFRENAKEYKQILKLQSQESARDTMYSEVLDLIASYENGFADYLLKTYHKLGSKLSMRSSP